MVTWYFTDWAISRGMRVPTPRAPLPVTLRGFLIIPGQGYVVDLEVEDLGRSSDDEEWQWFRIEEMDYLNDRSILHLLNVGRMHQVGCRKTQRLE